MKFGSVCSGIEAASVAWHSLGWSASFLSEIDAFPRAVLSRHYPDVPLHGDFTTIQKGDYAAIDLLVGGTPCQSFSVAGLRAGLGDPRGNLMLEFGALACRLEPRWIVWENVPGVLSSAGGRDFGTFLGMLAELGYGFAYRVLDAKFFGVAQRRRRVFVVGNLGDWRPAAAVLFERQSVSWNPAPSRKAGEDTSGSTGDGVARCLTTGEMKRQDWETCNMVTHPLRGEGFDASEDGAGRGTPLAPVAHSVRLANTSSNGWGVQEDVAHTLDCTAGPAVQHFMQVRRLTPVECERLQGFPDGYTAIPWRNKPASECPDGPRYKVLGNSMAVPVMHWIGSRIARVDAILQSEV